MNQKKLINENDKDKVILKNKVGESRLIDKINKHVINIKHKKKQTTRPTTTLLKIFELK